MDIPPIPGVELGVELGRGAHSIVYRAAQGGVPCAVKVPRTRARWTRWIYREAVALARVKHPGLPAVLEVGEVDGIPFLVMELVEGETLAERLGKESLWGGQTLEIGLQLAAILAAVHDVGLVHRDVKPRNIVVEPGGRVRLVDFGFVTPMERTGDGETAGTTAYAAPEQLVPPGRVDARSDLYCLGRVLLECLLREDFEGYALRGEALVDDLVRRGTRFDFATVIRHLLEREPSHRYSDAWLLAKDLEAVRAGTPISGPTNTPSPRSLTTTVRAGELGLILEAVGSKRSGGRLVLLQGTRGSGKSRLLASVEHTLRSLGCTISLRSVQADPPLATLRRFLEASTLNAVGDANGLDLGRLEALLGNLAPIAKVISPNLGLGAAPPAEAFEATDALIEGAAEIVIRLARHYGGLVAIVDDIQWMDRASADILVRAAHRVGEAALTLVLGSRNEVGQRPRLEAFLSMHAFDVPTTEVTLTPLSEEGVSHLVASYLATRSVDPLVVARIHAMADGTPLGVLEILGAFLDAGALRPQGRAWTFDPARLDRAHFPSSALALLGRRLGDIPAATRRVLEAAAIWGTTFRESHVAATLDVTVETIAYATVNATRAGVIEAVADDGCFRFVHDSVRETLLDALSVTERQRIHQRVGELLAEVREPAFEELCSAARHLAAGEPTQAPQLVYRVASIAAAEAFKRGDNEATLELQHQAAAAADRARLPISRELLRLAGEAHLRRGAVVESVAAFSHAIAVATDAVERAGLHGRVAWAYSSVGDAEKAWEALDRAFETLGERLPVENLASALTTTFELARPHVGRLKKPALTTPRSEREVDLLCALHLQNIRLAVEYGKVGRAIQSSLISHTLSMQTHSPATRARAQVVHGFVLTAVGRREAGLKEVEEAVALAKGLDDATAATYCSQMRAMALGWSGRFEEMLEEYGVVLDKYGPWSEVNEYLLQAISGAIVQYLMGRNDVAWPWIEKSIARARRSVTNHTSLVLIVQRARGALATLGRVPERGSWLEMQLERVSIHEAGDGYHRILTWGPRATYYYERGELGVEFERLVADFDAEKLNPRTIHLAGCEYYVVVAHARIQQCFAASVSNRKAAIAKLAKVAKSLRLVARIPPLVAHALLTEACLAWFEGDTKKTAKLFAEAEKLATTEGITWVIAAIARARAHILRSEGKTDAALDQARIAETLSREHGAIARARAIALEFGLTASAQSSTRVSSISRQSSRTNRQLAVLLHVVKGTRRDQKAEEVAASLLDELLRTLSAERGAIWFQPETPSVGTAVTRHRHSTASVSIAPESPLGALLREVHRRGTSWPASPALVDSGVVLSGFDPSRMLVVPLHLYEQPVGALAMERGANDPEFAVEDQQLLEMLAHQVPIALEIARLLAERERLHASLQQSQKLEAIGQLAGGLAHDFNNMLAAMKVALGIAQERAGDDEEMRAELDIIAQATTRASQLTSQLLTFSRSQPLPLQTHDVNQLVVALEPMLRRVAMGAIEVKLALSPIVDAVSIDAASFDQALMNLLINARDAMPNGGSFTISTRNVVLNEDAAMRANVAPGAYVELQVADTGEGMSPETMNRIFEPFFTTKPVGRGTGLGLATVWGFIKNCGGGIEVWSELGHGTRFTLYLKRVDRPRVRRKASTTSSLVPPSGSPDTILVVDDDDLVRRSIAKILERNGYRIITASGSAEAIDVARSQQGKRIALVIMDVLLPGVTGPELGRRLNDLMPAKILFVSGFSAESAPLEDAKVTAEMLLQKPFSQAALLARVRELMPSA